MRLDDPHNHACCRSAPKREGTAAPEPDFTGLGKIAALGIKVSRHCTYHGVALNVDMDLEPYRRINPCGYAGLQTVDLSTIGSRPPGKKRAGAGPTAQHAPGALIPHAAPHAMSTPEVVREASIHRSLQPLAKQKAAAKLSRIPIKGRTRRSAQETRLDPREGGQPTTRFYEIKEILREHKLHTVCEEASCPNIGECFGRARPPS